MDEKRIADSFSPLDAGSEEKGLEGSEPFLFTRLLEQQCPVYMAMGMSYDEYWNGSADLTRSYLRAHRIRVKQTNQELWLAGLYMAHALSATVGNMLSGKSAKKIEYPREPLPLSAAEQKEQDERAQQIKVEQMKASMLAFVEQHNRKLKEKDGD